MLIQRLIPTLALLTACAQAARIQVRTFNEDALSRVGEYDPKLSSTERWVELGSDRSAVPGTSLQLSVVADGKRTEPTCYFSGRLEDGVNEIAFVVVDDLSYIHPCGPHHGITILCSNPLPTCHGIEGLGSYEVTPPRNPEPEELLPTASI